MSESIKKITVNRDILVGTYFTNVDIDPRLLRRLFKSRGYTNTPITGPWKQIFEEGQEAYAVIGNDNQVVELLDKIDTSYFRRKPLTTEYEFLDKQEVKSVIKGKKYSVKYNDVIADVNQINAKSAFNNEAQIISGDSGYTGVFFQREKQEDYNVDISLIRSYDTLDTLSVKNNPLASFPEQNSDTGVVMGTLYARQKISDESGERVKIPLQNVPVIIFNPSDQFPTVASLDEEGDRITLNFIENSNIQDYADEFSFVTDFGSENARKKLGRKLKQGLENVNPILKNKNSINVPEQYLYSTVTNENGEFIIENVPVGNQILMFEVDLLKQGMTKDEVQFNFFPYPTSSGPNVDAVPHFYFRQIPVGVRPSWGTFSTGYTQIDITASIDMRKWSTYYVSPIANDGKNLSELLASGNFDSLNVLVKDMTKEGYPLVNEMVEVLDIYSRDEAQKTGWFNQVQTTKYQAQFRGDGWKAFRLPANLYDPEGYASKDSARNGLSSRKGVWLSAYEMKMLFGGDVETPLYRATGFLRKEITQQTALQQKASHFDINRGPGSGKEDATGQPPESSLNQFPYERPWTINYPNKYSIPSQPKNSEGKNYNIKLQPRFQDGDMPGLFIYEGEDDNVGHGYATMIGLDSNEFLFNRFGTVVTRYRIYKYENNSRWDDEWSNGFRPYYHQGNFGTEANYEVKNGEQYQRVEAGFSYWLKPEGWGRVQSEGWGDFMMSSDINDKYSLPTEDFRPKSYLQSVSSVFRDGEKLYLNLDASLPNWLRAGALDIYRVIDDEPEDLINPRPPEIAKFIKINCGDVLKANDKENNDRTELRIGTKNRQVSIATDMTIEIKNLGSVERSVDVGGVKKSIEPNGVAEFNVTTGAQITLRTNTDYDALENTYEKVSYQVRCFTSIKRAGVRSSNYLNIYEDGQPNSTVQTFYFVTQVSGGQGNVKLDSDNNFKKCGGNNGFTRNGTYFFNGILVEASGKSNATIDLDTVSIETQCSTGGFGIRRTS